MPQRHQPIEVPPKMMALIDDALCAFARDSAYAVHMAETAHGILVRRANWAARMELRAAADAAMNQCREQPEFLCTVTEACGTGLGCRWARPEHAEPLAGVAATGVRGSKSDMRVRPQPHVLGPEFNLAPAVNRLAKDLLPARAVA